MKLTGPPTRLAKPPGRRPVGRTLPLSRPFFMSRPLRAQAVEGAVADGAVEVISAEQLAMRLLQPGEMIELVARPSRWSVLFTSARWLVVCGLIAVGAPILAPQTGLEQNQIMQAAIGLAMARLALGMAQWFGVLYILTNRRVMSVRGLLHQHVLSTPLTEIRAIHLHRGLHERAVGVGTISIVTDDFCQLWSYLRDSPTIRDKLLRFVSRA